jgi:hypothetical protein
MVIIRSEQMKAFADALSRAFEAKLQRELPPRRPRESAALGDALPAHVRRALEAGKALGLAHADQLETFVECVLVFGPPPWSTSFGQALESGASVEIAAARFTKAARAALAQIP